VTTARRSSQDRTRPARDEGRTPDVQCLWIAVPDVTHDADDRDRQIAQQQASTDRVGVRPVRRRHHPVDHRHVRRSQDIRRFEEAATQQRNTHDIEVAARRLTQRRVVLIGLGGVRTRVHGPRNQEGTDRHCRPDIEPSPAASGAREGRADVFRPFAGSGSGEGKAIERRPAGQRRRPDAAQARHERRPTVVRRYGGFRRTRLFPA